MALTVVVIATFALESFHCGISAETVCIVNRSLRSESLFTVKLATIFIYTVLTFDDDPFPHSTHHNMAEIPSIPIVASDAPETSESIPLLTAATLRCLPSAPLRHSPLRQVLSRSAPASIIETATPFDEGDEPQNASDAGLFSKYIPPRRFQSCLYILSPSGNCSASFILGHPLAKLMFGQVSLGHVYS
jgi:hypothetical protein